VAHGRAIYRVNTAGLEGGHNGVRRAAKQGPDDQGEGGKVKTSELVRTDAVPVSVKNSQYGHGVPKPRYGAYALETRWFRRCRRSPAEVRVACSIPRDGVEPPHQMLHGDRISRPLHVDYHG